MSGGGGGGGGGGGAVLRCKQACTESTLRQKSLAACGN